VLSQVPLSEKASCNAACESSDPAAQHLRWAPELSGAAAACFFPVPAETLGWGDPQQRTQFTCYTTS